MPQCLLPPPLSIQSQSNQRHPTPGLNDSAVAAYYSLMVESAVLLGAERREAEQQLRDVLNFETTLANVSLTILRFFLIFCSELSSASPKRVST